jgi:hypothetical protein
MALDLHGYEIYDSSGQVLGKVQSTQAAGRWISQDVWGQDLSHQSKEMEPLSRRFCTRRRPDGGEPISRRFFTPRLPDGVLLVNQFSEVLHTPSPRWCAAGEPVSQKFCTRRLSHGVLLANMSQ